MGSLGRPGHATGIPVVAEGRTASLDGLSEDRPNRSCEGLPLAGADGAASPLRIEASHKEGLVDVDVPEAGDHSLVEQGRLEGSPRAGEIAAKSRGHGPRGGGDPVDPEPAAVVAVGLGTCEDHEIAESAGVDVPQRQPAGGSLEGPADMLMRKPGQGSTGHDRVEAEAAGHSQANPQHPTVRAGFENRQFLAVSFETTDRRPQERPTLLAVATSIEADRSEHISTEDPHRDHPRRQQIALERSSQAFDFG